MNNLMQANSLHTAIDAYATAQNEIAEAFEMLGTAKSRLRAAFGDYHCSVIPSRFSDHDLADVKKVHKMVKINAWRSIIDRCQIKNLISEKRNRELEDQIEKGELPEITVASVADMLQNFGSQMDKLLAETIAETFSWLRPRGSRYKTNTEFEIGEKVIREWLVDTSYGMLRLNHYEEGNLRSLDNAFHLLDGKGPIKYPGDLITQIRVAIENKKWECETDYFKCKWYKRGTMHITFKRMDLVEKINKIGGKSRLRKQ